MLPKSLGEMLDALHHDCKAYADLVDHHEAIAEAARHPDAEPQLRPIHQPIPQGSPFGKAKG